ncbi:MAG: protoporphyrinogen oxidase HemJ [Alphaproteobacteria bacterium]
MTLFHWVKALHVISVIAWMAALLYLPRLFAYHAGAERGSALSETFKTMERRLLRGIMNPAMILAWAMGLVLVFANPAEAGIDWTKGWVHTKALCVVLMTVLHHFCMRWRRDFAEDRNTRPARFYKFWNEMPAVLMVVIVVMVIGKPF